MSKLGAVALNVSRAENPLADTDVVDRLSLRANSGPKRRNSV